MRRAAMAIGALAVAALIVAGIISATGNKATSVTAVAPLSRAAVSKPLAASAPAQLAALHRRVNERVGGGARAFEAQLKALRGHPVVVNLWASWCDPCTRELPFMQREAVKRGAHVAFLGVNVEDTPKDAERRAAKDPMPYPSFEDPDRKIIQRYRAVGLPVTVFYDAAGRQQLVHQGVFASEKLLSDAIDRYALAN